jgi:hypothetical protein
MFIMCSLTFVTSFFFLFNGLRSDFSHVFFMLSSLSNIFNSNFHGEHDPSVKFTNSYGVLVNLFKVDANYILLKVFQFLIFSVRTFLWSNNISLVVIHCQEEIVVDEDFRLFPLERVCASFANVTSFSKFEQIEECLENLWIL